MKKSLGNCMIKVCSKAFEIEFRLSFLRPHQLLVIVSTVLLLQLTASSAQAKVNASFLHKSTVESVVTGSSMPASFIPVALYEDKTASALIVADSGGNRIWLFSGNNASVLAGQPIEGNSDAPDYKDGPSLTARFNSPSGVAVTANGVIYVADTGNYCIRKIESGVVSTVAGRSGTPGNSNGVASESLFARPSGLAIQDDGTLLIADGPNGIRELKNGIVSAIPLPANITANVNAVAVFESREFGKTLFYTTPDGFGKIDLSTLQSAGFFSRLAGAEGIVALASDRVVVSIPDRQAIYFADTGTVRRLVSGNALLSHAIGGFRDGQAATARFNKPRGLCVDQLGRIDVADSGNSRIRRISELDPRWMIGVANYVPPKIAGVYRVVFISNSVAYHDAMWRDSIEGIVEAYLNEHAVSMNIKKKVRIDAVRFGGAYLAAQGEYIRELLGNGTTDLVIWDVDSHMLRENFHDDLDTMPDLTPEHLSAWQNEINTTKTELDKSRTKLLLIDEPLGMQLGQGESYALKDLESIGATFTFREATRTPDYAYDFMRTLERTFASTKASFFPTYGLYLNYERGPHRPLYIADDFHANPSGNDFFAKLVIKALQRYEPWSK